MTAQAPKAMKTAAYRVETPRLILRCWSPEDAPDLRAALDESDRHLRPWIPFMKDESRSMEETVDWLRLHRSNFDSDVMYRYGVFEKDSGVLLGENMLLGRVGPGGFEVGYWTHVNSGGHGYATEASCAMIRVAFELAGVERVEIHCAPDNTASVAIPAKLGFSHEATLKDRAPDTEGGIHDLMIWTLFARDYQNSPAADTRIRAYDCLGNLIFEG
jgi:RimJ/RimL family protein N-acetyltransferase